MVWQPRTAQPIQEGQWQPKTAMPIQEEPSIAEGPMSRIIGGALATGQGGLPIFDEAGAYFGGKLADIGLLDPVAQQGQSEYEARLNNIRGLEKSFSKEYPKTDVGLRLAGAVGATLPAGAAMAARPIAAGATFGGMQGFLGGEGGAGQRVLGGTVGAGLGAGGGYIADKFLAPLAGKLAQKVGITETPALSLKQRELSNIERNLGLAGVSKEQYIANLLKSSPDDFAGELGGEALRMQTQAQAKVTGPSMQSAREAMRERLATAPERTRKILEDILGSEGNIADRIATIEQLKLVEPDLYKSVVGSIPKSEIADVLNTPAGRSAVPDAMVNIANRTVEPSVKKVASDVPISTAHEISKSLGSQVTRNPLTGEMTDPATGAPIESLRKQIVSRLREASPEFDLAQTAAAEQRSFSDALSQGRKLARMATGEGSDDLLRVALSNPADIPYAKAGFHQGLLDVVESVPMGTGNPAARIATPKIANRISEITGDAASGEKFSKDIMAEKLRMELANRGLYGSNTAETASSGISGIPLSKSGIAGKLMEKADDIINAKSNERLASALYATSPEEKQALAIALAGRKGEILLPDLVKRNALIEMLRSTTPAIPSQVSGALANQPEIPTITIRKKRGE